MQLTTHALPLELALGLVCRSMAAGMQQTSFGAPFASRPVRNMPGNSPGREAVRPASAPAYADAPQPGLAWRSSAAGPRGGPHGGAAAAPEQLARAPGRGLRANAEQSASPEDAVFVPGMLPRDNRGQTVRTALTA